MRIWFGSVLAVSLLSSPLSAQGAMRAAPSGRGTTEVTLTLVDSVARAAAKPSLIRIDYGQPHLRGRQLHAAGLVPYDSLWRLGANDATTLMTDVDLVLGGKSIPKGTYVLQALPTRAGWKLVVQKQMAPGEPAATTNAANELARIDLRLSTNASPLESLSMWLIPSTQPGAPRGELRMAWGTVALSTDWSAKQ